MFIKKISFFIASVFFIGKISKMPGTLGSLVGLIIFMMMNMISKNSSPSYVILFFLVIWLTIFIVGIITSSIYVKNNTDKDPKEIIIDEVAGQLFTLYFTTPFCYKYIIDKSNLVAFVILYIFPLVFFRIFDIFKPWPIDWFDKNIRGGLGVMLDDFVAAIFAIIFYNAFLISVFK